jgi:hypothetical protein
MWNVIINAFPPAVAAPISAVLALDARLVFAVMWALAALVVGAIVRSSFARREERFTRIPVGRPGQGNQIVTTRRQASRAA